MKTTAVRKLLPENWGFICPVHTPDGHPCGLLNHITMKCVPMPKGEVFDRKEFVELLVSLGMGPVTTDLNVIYPHDALPVMLDGVLVGYLE